jgi:hypothetical protein
MADLSLMADLVAEVELSKPTTDAEFYAVASKINLPWLFFACETLRRQYAGKKIGFLGRDCYLLQQIYQAYFEPDTSVYIPFSRKAAKDTDQAIAYLDSFRVAVLVDISSTGDTWQKIGFKKYYNVCALIYSDEWWRGRDSGQPQPIPPPTFTCVTKNSWIGSTNELVEVFNCGPVGSLIKLEPMTYAELEPDIDKLISVLHAPVATAVKLQDKYKDIPKALAALTDAQLRHYFKGYLLSVCEQTYLFGRLQNYLKHQNKLIQELAQTDSKITNISPVFTYSSQEGQINTRK